FRASALNSAVCVLRIFFVDIIHLVKRLYSLSKVSKSVGTDQVDFIFESLFSVILIDASFRPIRSNSAKAPSKLLKIRGS
ncbi:MAG: hypothetical protein PHE38_08785, partial [Alishewanella agri]|nr:hypothetical protein [Alishewanella agri]